MQLLIGTSNKNKINEISEIIKDYYDIITLNDLNITIEPPNENGDSYLQNSYIKAKFYSQLTGLPTLADDSGLEIKLLNNRPGIYSSRWAGSTATLQEKRQYLEDEMHKINIDSSPARYICAVTYIHNDVTNMAQEICYGIIKSKPSNVNGLLYDPYFYVFDKALSEYSLTDKNLISHRGLAIRKLFDLY